MAPREWVVWMPPYRVKPTPTVQGAFRPPDWAVEMDRSGYSNVALQTHDESVLQEHAPTFKERYAHGLGAGVNI
jgi:hypothetical protein